MGREGIQVDTYLTRGESNKEINSKYWVFEIIVVLYGICVFLIILGMKEEGGWVGGLLWVDLGWRVGNM